MGRLYGERLAGGGQEVLRPASGGRIFPKQRRRLRRIRFTIFPTLEVPGRKERR